MKETTEKHEPKKRYQAPALEILEVGETEAGITLNFEDGPFSTS